MILRSFATALFCTAGIAFAQEPVAEPVLAEDSLFIDFEKAIETVVKNNADIQEAKFLWRSDSSQPEHRHKPVERILCRYVPD